ncbi:acyltransferase [uncultured Sphaerotilus sp.]|uniref:acyltransferase family protein n=1 Tax=uncultured Sphaerotilus sp. TaxID=474984 RepID=UPI0030CA5A70
MEMEIGKKPERSHEIDLLRGVACISVVLFHFLYRGQQDDWITDRVGSLLSEIARYGYLGVDLFFIISGYVVFSSAQGMTVRAFVASRVARLYPAYWVAVCMTAGLAWALASPLFSVSPRDVLINLTMLMHLLPLRLGVELVDGAYWSLGVELQFYLMIVVVLWTGSMARIEALLMGWLLLSLVDFMRRMYLPTLWLALDWAPLFSAGIVFRLVRQDGLTRQRYLLLWCSLLLALAYGTAPDQLARGAADGSSRNSWVVAGLLLSFFGVFALIAARRWQLAASGLTKAAGLLTYPVYLLHQNIGYMLLAAWRGSGLSLPVRVTGVLLVVSAAAWVLHVVVERPFGPRLRRWVDPSR